MTERRAGLAAVVVGVGLLAGCGMRISCDNPNVDQRQCAQANATVAAADQEIKNAVDRAARQAVTDAAARAQVEARRQAASWWDQLVAGVLAMLGGALNSGPPVPVPAPIPVPVPAPPVAPAPLAASVTNIHFVPQITLNNTIVFDSNGKQRPNETTGLENCGPASVAMAIQKYRGVNSVTLEQVANAMRIKANSNVKGVNKPTNFRDPLAVAYLRDTQRLSLRDIATIDDLRAAIAEDHPVLVLVWNGLYVRHENGQRVPYPDPPKGKDDGWLAKHIVLAVGYDATNVYVEDPLAWPNAAGEGDHFRIPLDAFVAAADAEADTPGAWHASAVLPAG